MNVRIVEVARDLGEGTSPPLPTRIVYWKPSFLELTRRFPAFVDPRFRREELKFEAVPACWQVSRACRTLALTCHVFSRRYGAEALTHQLQARASRPTLFEELLALAAAYPGLPGTRPIVATGSRVVFGAEWHLPLLQRGQDGWELDLVRETAVCSPRYRILGAPLESSEQE
jgi:hypothetical protein